MQPFYYSELDFSPWSVVWRLLLHLLSWVWVVLAGQIIRNRLNQSPVHLLFSYKKSCQLFQKMKIKRVLINSNIEILYLVGGLGQESSPPNITCVYQLIIHKEQHHAMMETDSPTPFSSTWTKEAEDRKSQEESRRNKRKFGNDKNRN